MTIRELIENKSTLNYQQICTSLILTFRVDEKVNWESVLPAQQQQEYFGGETLRLIAEHPILSKQKDIRPISLKKGSISQMLFFYVCLQDSSLPKKQIQDVTKKFISGGDANRYIIWFFGNREGTALKVVLSAKEGKKIVLKTLPFGVAQPYYKTYDFIIREVNEKVNQLFVEPTDLWKALWTAFDISVINRKFYEEIKDAFDDLQTQLSKKGNPFTSEDDRVQFAIRLIGRIIFCWFLKRKDVLHDEAISSEAVKEHKQKNYYHDLLEPLFFDVLNTPDKERRGGLPKIIAHYPFLNGGLFDAQETDYKQHLLLNIENDWFQQLFSKTLERYNFTVDENSSSNAEIAIDPEMLGRIFENLLAEQNPETGETARKATGSFYTPREIVDYMVEQSITEFLKTALALDAKMNALIEDFVHTQVLPAALSNYEENLSSELSKLKVLDPACGSGAFPIGILQKVVALKQQLHPKTKNYKLKLDTIQNSIYGIDIQPMAVELSRLRCWLSLVVDEDPKDIKALPNLDFKFVCADSLADVPLIEGYVTDSLTLNLKELEENVEQYFSPDYKNKKKIKSNIERCIVGISKSYHNLIASYITKIRKEEKSASPTRLKQLKERMMDYFQMDAKWNSYDNIFKNKKVEFFNPTFFFPSAKNGFDIIIGNPPYGIRYTEEEIKSFRKNYKVVVGHSEAYYLFMERGMRLLKPNSVLSYITPNAWLSNKYAKEVRNLVLKENKLLSLINLNKKFVFENAGVEASVFLISNNQSKSMEVIVGNDVEKEKLFPFDITMWLNNENLIIGFSDNQLVNNIFAKIRETKTKLSDLIDLSNGFKPYQVGYGKNTQGKPLTAQDVEKRIYHSDTKINENYKKQIKGKNVNKYSLSWTEGFINWGDWLMSPKEEKYFENPKILIRQIISDTLFCTMDEEGYYADQSLYIAINYPNKEISLKYCTALLNSKLMGFYFRKFYSEEDALFPKIKVNELKDLPLRSTNEGVQKLFSTLVDYVILLKQSQNPIHQSVSNSLIAIQLEEILDGMVLELYFEEEMKVKKLNIIDLVESELTKAKGENVAERIYNFNKSVSHPDSEIRNRILSFALVSPDVLKPILQG
ncbi:MAG: TaqI-like C-terminal specificity domain-containing protein [Cyclobacteriaceae bacterium]